MGMTKNQLELVKCVAQNDLQKAKHAALACCTEDSTQKNASYMKRYRSMLQAGGLNMSELPANITSFAIMEDLSMTYKENRYYLTEEEKKFFS